MYLQKVKSKKLGKKTNFVGILSATGEKSRVLGSGSDPYQNVTDPQHYRWRSASVFCSVSDPISLYLVTDPVPNSSPTHHYFFSKFLHYKVFFEDRSVPLMLLQKSVSKSCCRPFMHTFWSNWPFSISIWHTCIRHQTKKTVSGFIHN
jgi:hypothetical protein